MAQNKVLDYLKEHEGQDITFEELKQAGLAPTYGALTTDLSRLTMNSGNGITRSGKKGGSRRYRYDAPVPLPEPEYATLRLIGQSDAGHGLGVDDETGRLYEIVPAGRLFNGAQ